MKRISLIFSFVALFAFGGNAQMRDLRFGLKVGPSADWANAGSVQTENKGVGIGLNAGLVVDYCLTSHFAASSGVNVNFMQMRYRFANFRRVGNFLEETDVDVVRRLKAANLEVPLKAKFSFDFADVRAYVEAGGCLGFNLTDYGKDSFNLFGVDYETEGDYSTQYRAFQPSLVFGLGAEYEVARKLNLFVQLTFNHALLNAFVGSLEQQTGSILRNNFIGLEVGFMH